MERIVSLVENGWVEPAAVVRAYTFRDKPSITRLVDNLERLKLVKRNASKEDRRKKPHRAYNRIGKELEERTWRSLTTTLNEALDKRATGRSRSPRKCCKDGL